MHGFINLLKPPGMTSSSAVVAIRKLLPRGTKVGHSGTLDPEAAGVLPVMIGKATRLCDYVMSGEKEYICELALGIATDTQDATGTPVGAQCSPASADEVRAVLPRFIGDIMQRPSAYSALKRDGRKLCDIARRGEQVEVAPRPVHIGEIEYMSQLDETGHLLRVECGKGTYIRALCDDIGRELGCGGHMRFLLRTRSGAFDMSAAHTIEEVTANIEDYVQAMDMPLSHMPALIAPRELTSAIRCGNKLPLSRISGQLPDDDVPARLYIEEISAHNFAGIVRREALQLRFSAMLWGEDGVC